MIVLYISSFFTTVLLLNFALQSAFFRLFFSLFAVLFFFKRFLLLSERVFFVVFFGVITAILRILFDYFFEFHFFESFEFSFLLSLKQSILQRLGEFFSPVQNAFLAGLLVGERESLTPELVIAFNRTGLTHILAISGYNISIIIAFVVKLLGFLPQKSRMIAAILFVIIFVLFVGPSPPVVRAGIMGVIALLAVIFNREYLALNALFLSGFVMAFIDLEIIYDDISFQLSFLATLGILLFSKILENYFKFLPEIFFIKQSVVMTMSAQILVLPIILVNFGDMSLVAPVANILVLPFIPLVMLGGFLVILFSYFLHFVSVVLSFFVYVLLSLMLFEISFLANLQFAAINLNWFNFWAGALYYFFILWFFYRYSRVEKINL